MSWTSRDLNLLYVDDDEGVQVQVAGCRSIKIRLIQSLGGATDLLLSERNRKVSEPIDLLFCDVNMEEAGREHTDDILWSVNADELRVLGYGPIIALPFISAAPWCQLVPMSSYWKNPNVRLNGYVLSSIALMLSLINGKPQDTTDAITQIDEWIETQGEKNLRTFLRVYLPKLREKILGAKRSGRLTIFGVRAMIRDLQIWKSIAQASSFDEQHLPLIMHRKPICVEIVDGDSHQEHFIHVSSLFADILDFGKPKNVTQIDQIIGELSEHWQQHSLDAPIRKSYEIARDILFPYMPGKDDEEENKKTRHWGAGKGSPLKRKIVASHVEENSEEFYFILRLSILLAWVRSWYLIRTEAFSRSELRRLVYHFLGSDRLDTPSKDYVRLLGNDSGSTIGTAPYRHEFRNLDDCRRADGEIDVLKAYLLEDEGEAITLTAYERMLCQHYIREGSVHCKDEERVDWVSEEAVGYPRWIHS